MNVARFTRPPRPRALPLGTRLRPSRRGSAPLAAPAPNAFAAARGAAAKASPAPRFRRLRLAVCVFVARRARHLHRDALVEASVRLETCEATRARARVVAKRLARGARGGSLAARLPSARERATVGLRKLRAGCGATAGAAAPTATTPRPAGHASGAVSARNAARTSASAARSRLPNEMGATSERRSVARRTLGRLFAASLVFFSDARASSPTMARRLRRLRIRLSDERSRFGASGGSKSESRHSSSSSASSRSSGSSPASATSS